MHPTGTTTADTNPTTAIRELPALDGSNGYILERLVATSRRFTCNLALIGKGQRADAKSLFSVATLRHAKHSPLHIEAYGVDATQALDAIGESLAANPSP